MKVRNLAKGMAYSMFAIMLSSCSSNEESSQDPVDPSVIRFNAIATRSSRAAVTTTANIKEFAVTAYTDGKMLMDNVLVTRNGSEWTYSPTAYWPDTPVNFYAISPDMSNSADIEGASTGTASISSYKNPGNVDLLYAVNMGEIQRGAPVNINFRHALSKVNVTLSSSNSTITVKINKVMIGNVYTKGSFFYPRATTLPGGDAAGYWHNQSELDNIQLFAATGTSGNLALTPEATDLGELNPGGNPDFFIPQELGRLAYDAGNKAFSGSYIAVDCEIFDKATGGKLFPGSRTPSYLLVGTTGCGRIMYPVTGGSVTEWKPGCSYIYNITIDNPSVLFDGIEFGVTVDEFVDGIAEETPAV